MGRCTALANRTLSGLGAAFAFLLITLSWPTMRPVVASAPAVQDTCTITTASRVVAIGDVHGAFDGFVRLLREAGLVNGSNRWTGGTAHLVQLGDVLDRGADSRKVLDLLMRLEREAERAGGRLHALLGNHEVMRMMGDLRYVSAGEYEAFRSPDASDLRERHYELSREHAEAEARKAGDRFDAKSHRTRFLAAIPLGYVEMQISFGPQGDYGRWLRRRPALARINDTLFVHGGIGPRVAGLGCVGVNAGVQRELDNLPALDDPKTATTLVAGSDGPLWFRGLADDATLLAEADVTALLREFGARQIVVGHTVPPDLAVRARFGGRVLQIDTGMLGGSFYPGGRPSAVEFMDGKATVIQIGKRSPLAPSPAQ